MATFLYILFFISCIVLVITVLLQPGKTDAGALFTSGVSSAALNPRGTQSVLSKITIGSACVFMLTALLLSLPAITGNSSVFDSATGTDQTAPANNEKKGDGENKAAATDKKDGEKSDDKADKSKEEEKSSESDKQKSEDKGEESKSESSEPKEAEKSDEGKASAKTEVKKSEDADK